MPCILALPSSPNVSKPNHCTERNPPIEEVIKQGVIPRFVEFLQRNDMPQLQVRAPPS